MEQLSTLTEAVTKLMQRNLHQYFLSLYVDFRQFFVFSSQNGKVERAKIRVEHIIREDYLVEAMEILEMYADLLLARFGLIQQVDQFLQ